MPHSVVVLDVRSAQDYHTLHVKGSINVSVPQMIQRRWQRGSLRVTPHAPTPTPSLLLS